MPADHSINNNRRLPPPSSSLPINNRRLPSPTTPLPTTINTINSNPSCPLPNRCDQCNQRCMRCDRIQPTCSPCLKSGLICTFFRKMKNKSSLYFIRDNINCFKVTSNNPNQGKVTKQSKSKVQIKVKRKVNSQLSHQFPTSSVYKLNSNTIPEIQFNFQFDFTSVFSIRSFTLHNFMTLIQCPSKLELFRLKDSRVFIEILKKFSTPRGGNKSLITYKPTVTNLDIDLSLDKLIEVGLFSKAIQSFFNNACLFGVVTTPVTFNKIKRSKIFMNAVLLTGLIRLPQDDEIKLYIQRLEGNLRYQVKHLFRLPINFDTLQVLIIIHCHLSFFPWSKKLIWGLVSYSVRLSQLLGLQNDLPKLSPSLQLERRLSYNTLMYLETYSSLISLPSLFKPFQFSNSNTFGRILNQLKVETKVETLSKGNCKFSHFHLLCLVVFNKFLESYNVLMSEVAELKWQFIKDYNHQELRERIPRLLTKINSTSHQVHTFLSRLIYSPHQNHLQPPHLILNDYKNAISILNYHLRFVTLTLNLYQPLNNLTTTTTKDHHRYIELAIMECHLTLTHTLKINTSKLPTLIIANLSQCLIFLRRHYHYIQSNEVKLDYKEGIKWFDNLIKDPANGFFAKYNSSLIKCIPEKVGTRITNKS